MSAIINPNTTTEYQFNITPTDETSTKFKISYGPGKLPLTFEIAPISNKLADGLFCFGLKQEKPMKSPSMGINLEGNASLATISAFKALEEAVSKVIGQNPMSTLYYSKIKDINNIVVGIDETKPPTLNVRLKYSNKNGKCYSTFKDKNGLITEPLSDLNHGFRGVYFIDAESVSKSQKGDWFINCTLNTCVVYRAPESTLGNDYL